MRSCALIGVLEGITTRMLAQGVAAGEATPALELALLTERVAKQAAVLDSPVVGSGGGVAAALNADLAALKARMGRLGKDGSGLWPLRDPEIARLFDNIRALQAEGVGIIYISHRMDEIKRIAGRITVVMIGEAHGY